MFLFLTTVWFFWEIKYVLLWIYLWQLKEYHTGRFLDHFSTHKGKKLLFSFGQIAKLVLLFVLLLDSSSFSYLLIILTLLYSFEFLVFLRQLFLKSFKKPVATAKTLFLSVVSFAFVILFLNWVFDFSNEAQMPWLVGFDILTPLIISALVLFFQPAFVLMRNQILRRAGKRIRKIKQTGGLKVVGITGSYGKTSTKEFLAAILSKKFKVLYTKEHQNSEIGIARAILKDLKPHHQFFIAEVGAYNKGKVRQVCRVLEPEIGMVTGVNEQHMALFGSMENLLSAEGGGELLDSLPEHGTIIVNGENKYCLDLIRKSSKLEPEKEKVYAFDNKVVDADIWAEDIDVKKDSVSFVVADKRKNLAHFNVNVLGRHNIQNLLAAVLAANEMGMALGEISEACKHIRPEQAGMVLKPGKHNINIIDSSYSANPDGVIADLEYLKVFPGKRVIVMPCLIELGPESPEIHQKIGKKIGQVCDSAIITAKECFENIKKGALESGMEQKNILHIENPQEIFSKITTFCKSGDAVLLEGRVPAGLINELL